jgi:hypothetical protein
MTAILDLKLPPPATVHFRRRGTGRTTAGDETGDEPVSSRWGRWRRSPAPSESRARQGLMPLNHWHRAGTYHASNQVAAVTVTVAVDKQSKPHRHALRGLRPGLSCPA